MSYTQENMQAMETDPEKSQTLDFIDKDFKLAMFREVLKKNHS